MNSICHLTRKTRSSSMKTIKSHFLGGVEMGHGSDRLIFFFLSVSHNSAKVETGFSDEHSFKQMFSVL